MEEGETPRFNMPFELGIDIGCKRFGQGKNRKCFLILEKEAHRYKRVLSDIAGQDIRNHANQAINAVKAVRDWQESARPRKVFDYYKVIWDCYNEFLTDKVEELRDQGMDPNAIWELPFSEWIRIMKNWIKDYKANH